MAWTLLKAQTCSRCGTLSAEWLDEDGVPVDPAPYNLRSYRCQGCVNIDKIRKEHKSEDLDNVQFYYERPRKWLTRVTKRGRAKNK